MVEGIFPAGWGGGRVRRSALRSEIVRGRRALVDRSGRGALRPEIVRGRNGRGERKGRGSRGGHEQRTDRQVSCWVWSTGTSRAQCFS
jgi:hypothetical protein